MEVWKLSVYRRVGGIDERAWTELWNVGLCASAKPRLSCGKSTRHTVFSVDSTSQTLCPKFQANPGRTPSGDSLSKDFRHLPPTLLKEPGGDSCFLTVYPCNSSNIYAPTLPVLLGRPENESGDLGWSVGHQPHCLGNSLENMALGLYLRVSETASGVRVGNHCPEVSHSHQEPFSLPVWNQWVSEWFQFHTWTLCWSLT